MSLGSRGPAMTGQWGRSASSVGGPVTSRTPEGGYRALNPGPVGAGNIGGGSGGASVGGAPPIGSGFNTNIPANPYLDKAFGYFDDLWNKAGELNNETYDKNPALEDFKDTRAQGYQEATAGAGSRGFGPDSGMSMAMRQRYGDSTLRGEQELAGNLWNAGLDRRTELLKNMNNILGGMTGAGSAIAGNQVALMGQGLDQARYGLDAWYKASMLPIEMEKAKTGLVTSQLAALGQIGSLL